MRCPPFIMGGGHYAYSFVTKRVPEKSRSFLGQYRTILSADAASEKYKLLSKKRR